MMVLLDVHNSHGKWSNRRTPADPKNLTPPPPPNSRNGSSVLMGRSLTSKMCNMRKGTNGVLTFMKVRLDEKECNLVISALFLRFCRSQHRAVCARKAAALAQPASEWGHCMHRGWRRWRCHEGSNDRQDGAGENGRPSSGRREAGRRSKGRRRAEPRVARAVTDIRRRGGQKSAADQRLEV